MNHLNWAEFVEKCKKWEEIHIVDDHGPVILGPRDQKPRFSDSEELADEKD